MHSGFSAVYFTLDAETNDRNRAGAERLAWTETTIHCVRVVRAPPDRGPDRGFFWKHGGAVCHRVQDASLDSFHCLACVNPFLGTTWVGVAWRRCIPLCVGSRATFPTRAEICTGSVGTLDSTIELGHIRVLLWGGSAAMDLAQLEGKRGLRLTARC
jgi:hypothetical protein